MVIKNNKGGATGGWDVIVYGATLGHSAHTGPHASRKKSILHFGPLEPFSSDCVVVPLATEGGERSAVGESSNWVCGSEQKQQHTRAPQTAHAYSHLCSLNETPLTQVVEVNRLKGANRLVLIADRWGALEIE